MLQLKKQKDIFTFGPDTEIPFLATCLALLYSLVELHRY